MSAIEYTLWCWVDGHRRFGHVLPDGYNGPRHAEAYIAQLGESKKQRKRHGVPVFKSGRVKFTLERTTSEEGGGYVWTEANGGQMVYKSDAEKY